MIEIYTDASVGNNKAISTCIVLTDVNYIGYRVFEFPGVNTSILGEILGAINAIEYAVGVVESISTSFTLYVDSIALLNLLKCDLKHTTNKQALLYREQLAKLKKLVKDNRVEMRLIRGHELEHNPNKVVDLISNSMLRFTK